MSEQVGYENPYRFQHLLGRAKWDEEKLCAEVKAYTCRGDRGDHKGYWIKVLALIPFR